MSENKNTQSRFNKDHLLLGAGAALVGAAVLASVSTTNEMGSIDTSYASELPPHDQSTSPASINLEPMTSTEQTPSFKGNVTIKKSTKLTSFAPMSDRTSKDIQIPKLAPEKGKLNFDNAVISKEAQKVMDDNAAYIDGLGCSGFTVRNPTTNVAEGVVTAEHCALFDNKSHWGTPRILGSDGKTYVVFNSPLEVDTGKFSKTSEKVGTIREIYVPTSKDNTVDIAIAAFEGNRAEGLGLTAQEVLAHYNANKLSENEINLLKLGDQAYLSGWPQLQPNTIGAPERQDFSLRVLGIEKGVNISDGKVLNILWAALPDSKTGTVCSFGNSGGQGFVMINGKQRSIGDLAAFVPFESNFNDYLKATPEDNEASKKEFEKKFKVKLPGVSAVCGFNFTTPDEVNTGTNIEVVNSYQEIPGYVDSLIEKASDEFFDPNYVKTWVSGTINLDSNGKGNWKMNPVIFYDKESDSAVLASYTDNTKDGLELDYIPNFKNQKFHGQPKLNTISGGIDVFTGQFGSNGFVSKTGGLIIGQYFNDPASIESAQKDQAFSLYYDDSTQSLQIMQYKHN